MACILAVLLFVPTILCYFCGGASEGDGRREGEGRGGMS